MSGLDLTLTSTLTLARRSHLPPGRGLVSVVAGLCLRAVAEGIAAVVGAGASAAAAAVLAMVVTMTVFSTSVEAAQSESAPAAGELPVLEVGGDWLWSLSATQTEGLWSTSVESLLRLKLRLGDYPWKLSADVGLRLGRMPAVGAGGGVGGVGAGDDWSLTAELERAYLKLSLPSADISVGRQQVSWGVGYAWSPTDVFNPPLGANPEGLRPGVNALVVRVPTGSLAYWSVVAAKEVGAGHGHSPADERTWLVGTRFHGNLGGVDWSVAAADDGRATMLGADAKGDLAVGGLGLGLGLELGWHGEAAWRVPAGGSAPWLEGVVGFDHAWGGGALIWTGECFYNSRGADARDAYDYLSWLGGDSAYLARYYGFTQLTCQYDEFTSVFGSVLANLVDRSAACTAGVRTLLGGGWQVSFSATAMAGEQGSEFAAGTIPAVPMLPARPGLILQAQAGYSF